MLTGNMKNMHMVYVIITYNISLAMMYIALMLMTELSGRKNLTKFASNWL